MNRFEWINIRIEPQVEGMNKYILQQAGRWLGPTQLPGLGLFGRWWLLAARNTSLIDGQIGQGAGIKSFALFG